MPDANPAPSPGIRTLSSTVSTVASSASAASTAEHLDIETLSQDSLDSEIAMLRIVTRRVLDLSSGVEDLETAFKLLALLSQASVLPRSVIARSAATWQSQVLILNVFTMFLVFPSSSVAFRLSSVVRLPSPVLYHPSPKHPFSGCRIRSSSFHNYLLLKNTHHRTHSRSTSCP